MDTNTTPTPPAPPDVTDAAAYQEIWTIRNDPGHAFNQANHPRREEAMAHMDELYAKAYAEAPATAPPAEAGTPATEPEAITPTNVDPTGLPGLPEGLEWGGAEGTTLSEAMAGAQDLGIAELEVRGTLLPLVASLLHQDPPDPEASRQTLEKEWGVDFPRRLRAAQLATERFGPAVKRWLNETGLGDAPDLIRHMAALGAPLLDAREQIDAIRADPKHPAWNPGHPGHAAGQRQLDAMYAKVYGRRPA